MSRVGVKFGKLTVIAESKDALRCRCECGREAFYPLAISKPSYKGRKQCSHCAGRACEVCGKWIEATSGQQSMTCSISCRKIRASRKEIDRYHRVKDSNAWKSVRAAYLEGIKDRIASDPTFAEIYRAYRRKVVAESVGRINQDPIKREAFLIKKREIAAAWRVRLLSNPDLYKEHLSAARMWYKNLSEEDRERIFYEPRRRRLNQGGN